MEHLLSKLLVSTTFIASVTAVAVGCSDDDTKTPPQPDDVSCSKTVGATDESSLISGASSVGQGGCVVIANNITTTAPVLVGAGVTLVSAKGTRAILTSTAPLAAVMLANEKAQLGHLDIVASEGSGVTVTGRDTKLFDVKVTGAKKAGVSIIAADAPASVTLENVALEKNVYGLYALGAQAEVTMTGGRVAENGGNSLSSGVGVVAAAGAKLALDGVTVEKNEGTGVLLDGEATRATIKNATVSENRERGIWGQGLKGSLDAPALTVEETQVSKNRIVGVGGVELKGIIIVGGSVKETVASPITTNLSTTEPIGDGVGIFGGSTDWKIERTNFERNDRAAGVVDGTEVGIIIVGGKVEPGPSGLRFVVQNSSSSGIQIPTADKTVPPKPLGISAPKIRVPAAL